MLLGCLRSNDSALAGRKIRPLGSCLVALLVTAALWLGVSEDALASSGSRYPGYFHPDLQRAALNLNASTGADRYAALREVWRLWDRAEPDHIEAILRWASEQESFSPAHRAYAGALVAYSRLRRGDLVGARRRIGALGYIDQWLVLGPFDNTGGSGFESPLVPQQELDQPIVFGRAYSGKEGRLVRWREVPSAFPYGWVDAGALLRPERPICAFFVTHLLQEGLEAERPLSLWVGARGSHRVYWNGQQVLEDALDRGHDFDRRAAEIQLSPGVNRLTVEVCGRQAAPMLSVRFASADGSPDPQVTVRALSAEPVPDWSGRPRATGVRAGRSGRVHGPLDWLEQQLKSQPESAHVQEQLARYLLATGGDDQDRHDALDASLAAVQLRPTVERWLLAAQLAPDRNQRLRFIESAERAVESSSSAVPAFLLREVQLTRARWLESGLSPQKALPLYEKVLASDPTNLEALSGLVRRYQAAGLTHSALSRVRAARKVDAHAVGLLSLEDALLTEQGRTVEASELRALYSALRFDDQRPLLEQLELARRNRKLGEADHLAQRLLDLSPDSPWVHGVVSKLHRSLGRADRAEAYLHRALALAPSDATVLRQLADLYGARGDVSQQMELLQKVVGLEPQNEEARRYLAALKPTEQAQDEAYAWAPERFLEGRFSPPTGVHQRTLLDLSVDEVFDNGSTSRFRQVVFQPLTATGAALARQYVFGYQADRQVARLRGARVYRANGRTDEAIESGVAAADNPALSMYTSARSFYVQFPRLEPGDVVELRYRIDDVGEREQWSGYFGEVRYFQQSTPVEHVEYTVVTPKDRPLFVDAQRLPSLVQSERVEGDSRIYRFEAKKIPALNPEPHTPPWPEVAGFVHVSTYPSYEQLGQWYWGLSRDQLQLDEVTTQLLERLVAGAQTVEDKVRAVYGWVVRNTRYVALEFGIHGYKPRPCSQTVARGWGDCKDKATVIVAFLKHLGIDATVVLVRTAQRGRFQSTVASLSPFDHAIAYVPALDLYLDGTAEYTGSTELPQMDRGALGLLVNEGNSRLVTLPDHDPTTHTKKRSVEVFPRSPHGIPVKVAYETIGPDASGWRRRYASESTRRDRVLEDLLKTFPTMRLEPGAAGLSVRGLDDLEVSPRLEVLGRIESYGRIEGGNLSVAVLPPLSLVASHAALAERQTELEIDTPATLVDEFILHLSDAQRVVSLPKAVRRETPFGLFEVEVLHEPGDRIVARTRLEWASTRVSPLHYQAFRQFCEEADQAFGQRVVLALKGAQ